MTINHKENIINSSLWAAYGDAIGFISELAEDKGLLVKRTGKDHISGLVKWSRQIGGMYGPIVSIPSGAYSDDTQLRLSTSRAINQSNYFDINAFSKVELPVWTSYALGAGVGSKLAAESLGKKTIAWYNNFYNTKKASYVNSGGNGAAMRIQPHVWASRNPAQTDDFLLDVIRNSLATHGHPRAIAGAVFHALCLSHVLINSEIPSTSDARLFLHWIHEIPKKIRADINLSTAWVPLFESQSNQSLENAYEEVYKELVQHLDMIEKWQKDKNTSYSSLVDVLDLRNKKIRGSGTLTAIAALAASHLHASKLNMLMLDIANQLGTDTDSIATMVGALRGFIEGERPPQEVQDQPYLIYDAERLYTLSIGESCSTFNFPDTTEWTTPTSSLDFIGIQEDKIIFPPFGEIKAISEEFRSNSTDTYQYCYQWMVSDFNQSFLVKRRSTSALKSLNVESKNIENQHIPKRMEQSTHHQYQIKIPADYRSQTEHRPENAKEVDLDSLTSEAIKNNFDESVIGKHLTQVTMSLGVNGAVAYSAIIAKAIIARKKKQ
ncbi:ADP-ribosylglycohydrolase family protein [Vibrio metschnikovii]|uniref:ADP-ribosylglycohydrolase family protein n=1 Tax=Vibrio metschnikovii TaxID=28172 RepID=UPI001C30DF1A|nr:ADP-ribosylglycohydrolase family protein [Vibrio metschnikovii]